MNTEQTSPASNHLLSSGHVLERIGQEQYFSTRKYL